MVFEGRGRGRVLIIGYYNISVCHTMTSEIISLMKIFRMDFCDDFKIRDYPEKQRIKLKSNFYR